MNIITWIVFGLIVGSIANSIDPNSEGGGWVGTMILATLGSILGGFLGNLLFSVTASGFNFKAFFVSVFGALLLLYLRNFLETIEEFK